MTFADRWGVTDEEVLRTYPCDEHVPVPVLSVWRGVSVHARPEDVWPWVTQIRLAPYSYDCIDNLGRRSPQELRGLPEPVVGEAFTTAANRPHGRILSTEPGRHMTGSLFGGVMSYVVAPADGSSRLLMKFVAARLRAPAALIALGDLVMARRQLLNLAALAERGSHAGGG